MSINKTLHVVFRCRGGEEVCGEGGAAGGDRVGTGGEVPAQVLVSLLPSNTLKSCHQIFSQQLLFHLFLPLRKGERMPQTRMWFGVCDSNRW